MIQVLIAGVLLATPLMASDVPTYGSSSDEFDINSISSFLDDDSTAGSSDIKASVGSSYSYSSYSQGPAASPTAQSYVSPTQSGFSPSSVASSVQSPSSSGSSYYSQGYSNGSPAQTSSAYSSSSYNQGYQSSSPLQSSSSYNQGYHNNSPAQTSSSFDNGYHNNSPSQSSSSYDHGYHSNSPSYPTSSYSPGYHSSSGSSNGQEYHGSSSTQSSSYGAGLETGAKPNSPTGHDNQYNSFKSESSGRFNFPPNGYDNSAGYHHDFKSSHAPYKPADSGNSEFYPYKPQYSFGSSHGIGQSQYSTPGSYQSSFGGSGHHGSRPFNSLSHDTSGPEGSPISWGGDAHPGSYSPFDDVPPHKQFFDHGPSHGFKDFSSYKGPHADFPESPNSYPFGYKHRPQPSHPGYYGRPSGYRSSKYQGEHGSRYPRHPRPSYPGKKPSLPPYPYKYHSHRPGRKPYSPSSRPRPY